MTAPVVHARPEAKGMGSLCDHRCRGPFATRAREVTCRRCLRWPEAIARAYAQAERAAGEPEPKRSESPAAQQLTDAYRASVGESGHVVVRGLLELAHELARAYFGESFARPVVLMTPPSSPRAWADHCRHDPHGIQYRIRVSPRLAAIAALGWNLIAPEGRRRILVREGSVGELIAEGAARFAADVMLHELVHVACSARGVQEPGYKGHGPDFAAECNRIGAVLALPDVAARPRGENALADCAQWPICVRPPDYYGPIEPTARPRRRLEREALPPSPEPEPDDDDDDDDDDDEQDAPRRRRFAPRLAALAKELSRSPDVAGVGVQVFAARILELADELRAVE